MQQTDEMNVRDTSEIKRFGFGFGSSLDFFHFSLHTSGYRYTMGYYSSDVLACLVLMVLFGAGRTIAIKIFFQLGFDDPLLVVVLDFAANLLSLPTYYFLSARKEAASSEDSDETESTQDDSLSDDEGLELDGREDVEAQKQPSAPKAVVTQSTSTSSSDDGSALKDPPQRRRDSVARRLSLLDSPHNPSMTGLTVKVSGWIHCIPWWAKPMITGALQVLEVTFYMVSILYLSAAVAEMFSSGLQLVCSAVASQLIRKRTTLLQRWLGLSIVTVGLIFIAAADFIRGTEESRSLALGVSSAVLSLILGSVIESIQELFMQEARFSAALLNGMESLYGLLISVPMYFAIGPLLGYDPIASFAMIGEAGAGALSYTVGLLLVLFTAEILTYMAAACTSSMTRNLWGSLQAFVVWVFALIIYYATGRNGNLGEPWSIPASIIILTGFVFMIIGFYVYYLDKLPWQAEAEAQPSVAGETEEMDIEFIEGEVGSPPEGRSPSNDGQLEINNGALDV